MLSTGEVAAVGLYTSLKSIGQALHQIPDPRLAGHLLQLLIADLSGAAVSDIFPERSGN